MGMKDWELVHVGISVKKMEEAVEYFKSLGGTTDDNPGHVLDSGTWPAENFTTYGETDAPPWKIKIKMLNIGPLTLELTEPMGGGNWNETWLDEHGEGMNHIAYRVDDLEKEVAEMEALGVPAMYHLKGMYSYLDARKVGGLVIELMQKRDMPPRPQA